MNSNAATVWISHFSIWIVQMYTHNEFSLKKAKERTNYYWSKRASLEERDLAFQALYMSFLVSGFLFFCLSAILWLAKMISPVMFAVPSVVSFSLLLTGVYFVIREVSIGIHLSSLGRNKFKAKVRKKDSVSNIEYLVILPIALFLGYLIQIWISNAALS